MVDRLSYSAALITQPGHKFYTLTMPSDVLAQSSFIVSREENHEAGFQRLLDEKRAQEIADYIDSGLGTIPTSIVLSAQPDANFQYDSRNKTVEFDATPTSFLILDGQHRVYGFGKANSSIRVPVVIYGGLSRKDESRLFIDINTKQKPVPRELILDIKKLAEYEQDVETYLGELFDLFDQVPESALLGRLSPRSRQTGRISRVTFNSGMKPLISTFGGKRPTEIFSTLNCYFMAVLQHLKKLKKDSSITKPTVFKAFCLLFPDIGSRHKDKFDTDYSVENFEAVLEPIFSKVNKEIFEQSHKSAHQLEKKLSSYLRSTFTL